MKFHYPLKHVVVGIGIKDTSSMKYTKVYKMNKYFQSQLTENAKIFNRKHRKNIKSRAS